MMPYSGRTPTRTMPIEELRKPHPEQKRIDAEAAALLRATALDTFRRMAPATPGGFSVAETVTRRIG
jgi:hypothetical protein